MPPLKEVSAYEWKADQGNNTGERAAGGLRESRTNLSACRENLYK